MSTTAWEAGNFLSSEKEEVRRVAFSLVVVVSCPTACHVTSGPMLCTLPLLHPRMVEWHVGNVTYNTHTRVHHTHLQLYVLAVHVDEIPSPCPRPNTTHHMRHGSGERVWEREASKMQRAYAAPAAEIQDMSRALEESSNHRPNHLRWWTTLFELFELSSSPTFSFVQLSGSSPSMAAALSIQWHVPHYHYTTDSFALRRPGRVSFDLQTPVRCRTSY